MPQQKLLHKNDILTHILRKELESPASDYCIKNMATRTSKEQNRARQPPTSEIPQLLTEAIGNEHNIYKGET